MPKPPAPRFALGRPWGPRRATASAPDRPFVYLNAAMTADGKLAPANRRFEPFGSAHDRRLLFELRTYADAVMSGARTIDLNPVTLGNGGRHYAQMRREHGLADYPVRVVVSGHASIDPRAAIFKRRFSPILVLASEAASDRNLRRLRPLADEVAVFGREEIDFPRALRWLRTKWQVKRLLCEGGGEVNGALFLAGLVDEVYLTLCPLILGGRTAPTLADGRGVMALSDAPRLALRRQKRVGDELFLVYQRARSARGPD